MLSLLSLFLAFAPADDPAGDGAPVVPRTRAELKQLLEASKQNVPRLPLPPLTDEEEQRLANPEPPKEQRKGAGSGLGGGIVNNGRMRKFYLPASVAGGGFQRQPDPSQTLDYPFQTRLFWIVSRGNNCTYCMGHQETKLASAGLTDDEIASLDGDWSDATPAQRAAYAFTRKLTFEPNNLTDDDIEALRAANYTDTQILEIIAAVAGFNAMNRWTGALRIPQEDHREYLTPTSDRYRDAPSQAAPATAARPSDTAPACALPARRPGLESRAEVIVALNAARDRKPRLPLVDESATRDLFPEDFAHRDAAAHTAFARLLANFPVAGPTRVRMHVASVTDGELAPEWKGRIYWIAARNDRAWYALGHAGNLLRSLGWSDDQIFALDDPDRANTPAEKAVRNLARKLTVDPALITDADIEDLRKEFSDRQVAEVVYHVTEAAYFDRLTEAAALPLEADLFPIE